VNVVNFDNYITEYVRDEIYHPICFTSTIEKDDTFYLSLATIETWFLDLDLDIFETESSDLSIW
jgi:hypothetical protein